VAASCAHAREFVTYTYTNPHSALEGGGSDGNFLAAIAAIYVSIYMSIYVSMLSVHNEFHRVF
jgi:hypothetical protein